jgi:DNA invertase Pin-like site-specific DNA recombinase
MRWGYARTSTDDQKAGLEAQIKALESAGCGRIYREHASAVGKRPEFEKLMERIEEGDTLTVTKIDRLARNVRHMLEIIEELETRGAALRILDFNGETVDSKSPTGRLMLQLVGAFAEFERAMMLERQRPGIEKAKRDGKYRGRVPTAMRQARRAKELEAEGKTRAAIAAQLGISERSVYRALASAPIAEKGEGA